MIRLSGFLICADAADVAIVRDHLPQHIRLTRAEPGCMSFDVTQTSDPLIWKVDESFTDRAAFDAHQTRTGASDWYRATRHLKRDFSVIEG
jgi:quinol monooxygenase YgiN